MQVHLDMEDVLKFQAGQNRLAEERLKTLQAHQAAEDRILQLEVQLSQSQKDLHASVSSHLQLEKQFKQLLDAKITPRADVPSATVTELIQAVRDGNKVRIIQGIRRLTGSTLGQANSLYKMIYPPIQTATPPCTMEAEAVTKDPWSKPVETLDLPGVANARPSEEPISPPTLRSKANPNKPTPPTPRPSSWRNDFYPGPSGNRTLG